MRKDIRKLMGKIGYEFNDVGLLKTAVTHTSYANEHRRENVKHNERLEFLGDAVLEVVSSEYLYKLYPNKGEGELSTLRASMVCEPSLAICARDMGLPDYLLLGKGEELMRGREKDSITSDATEAVIGAIYLDGGFEAAKKFVLEFILGDLKTEDLYRDTKTELQEIVQNFGSHVDYELVSDEGPDHDKTFVIRAVVDGNVVGTGSGRTKKQASKNAAKAGVEYYRQNVLKTD